MVFAMKYALHLLEVLNHFVQSEVFHLPELHNSSFFFCQNIFFYLNIFFYHSVKKFHNGISQAPSVFFSLTALPWLVQLTMLPGQSVPSCPACCLPGPPGLTSRTSAQPGSPSLHHCSRFLLPSCKMSQLFFSCVPLCSSLKTCWASTPGGLHQGIDRDAKDRVSRIDRDAKDRVPLWCPCHRPASRAHPIKTLWACPPSQSSPTLPWPNSHRAVLGNTGGGCWKPCYCL